MNSLIKFPGRTKGGLVFWVGGLAAITLAIFGPIMMWTLLAIPSAVALPFYIKSSAQRRRHRRMLNEGTPHEARILRLETYGEGVKGLVDLVSALTGGGFNVDDWVCAVCAYEDKYGVEQTAKSPMFRYGDGMAEGLAAKVYVDEYDSDRYTVEVIYSPEKWDLWG